MLLVFPHTRLFLAATSIYPTPFDSSNWEAISSLVSSDEILSLLKQNLHKSQKQMKNEVDLYRIDKAYNISEWVFVKLKTYRQLSVAERHHHKLSKGFLVHFKSLNELVR